AITNYVDLQALILESGSDLRVANAVVDETLGHGSPSHTNTNSTAKDYKFVRGERIFSREEYTELAQLYFWTHQDRPGFKTVLDGITLLGIDNDLGINDPMVNCFLNNIMRADDDEIQRFYDLLGYAITQARALRGDERYLAFLCNARTLFGNVYDFLNPEDDLEKVQTRIEDVKKQLAQGADVLRSEKGAKVRGRVPGTTKTLHLQSCHIGASGEVEELPEIRLENLLMQADWYYNAKEYVLAKTMYDRAAACATGSVTQIKYDGTTARNAAAIGKTRCTLSMPSPARNGQGKAVINHQLSSGDYVFDRSMRAALVILEQAQLATNGTQGVRDDAKVATQSLSPSHPAVISYLGKEILRLITLSEFDQAIRCCIVLEQCCGFVSCDIYVKWGAILAGRDQKDCTYSLWLRGLSRTLNDTERRTLRGLCARCPGWAGYADLLQYPRIVAGSMLAGTLAEWPRGVQDLRDVIEWRQKQGQTESRVRSALRTRDMHSITSMVMQAVLTGHGYDVASILLQHGMTNEAVSCYVSTMANRMSIAGLAGPAAFVFPSPESLAIDRLMPSLPTNVLRRYVFWLAVNKSPGRSNDQTTQDRLRQCLRQIAAHYPYATNFPTPFLRDL
ncbi:MAG: hypothetical protein NTV22_01120, partial [bacterium]|nr:hypothetical protein [bacterium]